MDAWAALRLQVEWGADEALGDAPVDRRCDPAPPAAPLAPAAAPSPPAARGADLADVGSLAELRAALAEFRGCALRDTATSLVTEDGNPAAGLVVVGDAPSDDDDREGRPFSGQRGAQLGRVFASVGLGRDAMLLTTIVPWRPPGNRTAYLHEIQACLPFFWRRLALVRPRRLVLLGEVAARALGYGVGPIGRLRGRWRPLDVPDVGPVPSLAMRPIEDMLKTTAIKRETWADLLALRAELDRGGEGESELQP